ncbi:hypothetical protein GCM10023189_51740 [Nibrella saemangeumensis]|uniref:HTH araC/xylS-type domain-containing protein n=1 Tax=Nibrella saemangeumensis TaxID=1084526 RepID=A0ABP8NLT1_9BACT
MNNYNKIIESLVVSVGRAEYLHWLHSLTVSEYGNSVNVLLKVYDGQVTVKGLGQLEVGDLLFIPAGKALTITFGDAKNAQTISLEGLKADAGRYIQPKADPQLLGQFPNSFGYISFGASVFEQVDFFAALEVPPFVIRGGETADVSTPGASTLGASALAKSMERVLQEVALDQAGKDRLIHNKTEEIVIGLIRYMLDKGMFIEQLVTNSTYFNDPRLINLFSYIKENLGGDLSNKALANVAHVSEDYLGQYFKHRTGMNPQDYIEYQRMEAALELLGNSRTSIKEIGARVGYKDTAYFCRRFKRTFGIPAAKMRQRGALAVR